MKRLTILLASVTVLAACKSDKTVAVDTVAPTVTSIAPSNLVTNIPRNPSITATFSETMTASTINATTFTLTGGGASVPGVVTYAVATATLVPIGILAANTVYTVTISTGAKDAAGNPLAAAKTWTFTTVATPLSGPSAVNLGTAGNYAILAKSAVSTPFTTTRLLGAFPLGMRRETRPFHR